MLGGRASLMSLPRPMALYFSNILYSSISSHSQHQKIKLYTDNAARVFDIDFTSHRTDSGLWWTRHSHTAHVIIVHTVPIHCHSAVRLTHSTSQHPSNYFSHSVLHSLALPLKSTLMRYDLGTFPDRGWPTASALALPSPPSPWVTIRPSHLQLPRVAASRHGALSAPPPLPPQT